MTSRISVVIPVRDEASIIAESLGRLATWRERGHEVIMVDGHSSDASVALARPLCDRIVETAPGRARQMNAGAAAAAGDVLLFLHIDTLLPSAAIAELEALACDEPACWGRFDVRLDAPARIYRLIETLMNWRSRWSGIATGDQAMFVSRALFDRCGAFPVIALMEDIAFSANLRRVARPRCLRSRVTTSARRWQRDGVVSTILKMWCLRAAFFCGISPEKLRALYERDSKANS